MITDENSAPETGWHHIIITGAFLSGKSTFIHTASEMKDSVPSPESITVTMDFGRISVDGGAFYIWGTPGARRFDFMWEILATGKMVGFIVMVDSTCPLLFREARSILETFHAYCPSPFVVAANFQDKPGAWDIEALRIALRLPPEIPIVPCVATEISSVKNVLLALCYKILEDIEEANISA